MSFDWQGEINEIAHDHYSPSSALAAKASDLLGRVTEADPELIAEVARGLVLSQPSMAAIVNVANVALRAMQVIGVSSVPKALQALQEATTADRHAAAIALSETLDEPVTVVTHSASAAVIEALQLLRRDDKLTNVVLSESRPILEGTALARWLADQGYKVTLTNDAGLAEQLKPGCIFVVGSDAILPGEIVNKLGTRVLATWAHLSGVPTYVLASRDKIYPPGLVSLFRNPNRPASELIKEPPEGLLVDNRAFDATKWPVWSHIFVGRKGVHEAMESGDHVVATGLEGLLEA